MIDWLPGEDNSLLMTQTFIPDTTTGSRMGRREEGFGVVRLDTSNLRTRTVEAPRPDATRYIADGRGVVRMMATRGFNDATGQESPVLTYSYRTATSRDWRPFGTFDERDDSGLRPVAVDPDLNAAYAFGAHNGRTALFRVKLDGSMQRELVASHDQVDVDGLMRVGRRNRVVGASFATDKR